MPKSKEMISDSESSASGSSEEEVKSKSKPKKQEKKKAESSASDYDSEEDTKSKKRTKKNDKAPSKKAKKDVKTNEDGDSVWDIGGSKQVSVRHFKGRLFVDIREMYTDKDGELKPGRKGICMNMENWKALVKVFDEVDKCVKSKS